MSQVLDETAGRVLVEDLDQATSWWGRFRGLMLRGELAAGRGLLIEPCSSIHMMFMRFPIDAVFYDRDQRVTKVARRVRPWIGLSGGGRGARGVIELPVGAADGVEAGHQLRIGALRADEESAVAIANPQ
ncbi:MAG: DUF192 domain-containing protein [Dehalococcoidia bacterium]|nr:DUF192 domain-containing protein [Dehalococcoidia bacterium]